MGYWGYFPKDGDGPCDLLGLIGDSINARVRKILNQKLSKKRELDNSFERAGLVQLLLEKGFWINIKTVKKAVKYLDKCLNDELFISGFRDHKKARRLVSLVKNEMQKLIDQEEKRTPTNLPKRKRVKKKRDKSLTSISETICVLAPKDWLRNVKHL